MFVFKVKDMRVSGQGDAVMQALKHVDASASIQVDVSTRKVRITCTTAGATEWGDAIVHAGLTPVLTSNARVGLGKRTPAKIPFGGGSDHDFSVCSGSGDPVMKNENALDATTDVSSKGKAGRASASIAGVSRLISVLPAEALGPLAHMVEEPGAILPLSTED